MLPELVVVQGRAPHAPRTRRWQRGQQGPQGPRPEPWAHVDPAEGPGVAGVALKVESCSRPSRAPAAWGRATLQRGHLGPGPGEATHLQLSCGRGQRVGGARVVRGHEVR